MVGAFFESALAVLCVSATLMAGAMYVIGRK